MIKYSEIEQVFGEAGLTVYEYNIDLNETEISTPFIVYTPTDAEYFEADGINYLKLLNVGLAFIDETLNFTLQNRIETVLSAVDTMFDKTINFDNEERLYSVSYTFQVFDDNTGIV